MPSGGLIWDAVPEELLDVRAVLQVMRMMRRFLIQAQGNSQLECLVQWGEMITPNTRLEERIGECVDEDSTIKDSASPALRTIRRQMATVQNQIRSRLHEIVHGGRFQKVLQDFIVTMRAGRYVVPVKQEHKDALPGIIHDISSSGATVFVEPEAVVRLNNELRRLTGEEEREIQRILRELSQQVGDFADLAMASLEVLAHLDFTFAKARYSMELDAACPQITDDCKVTLLRARHPLLGKDVVPNDIYLGEGYRALVITGPNTGGKTVVLKTLGLFVSDGPVRFAHSGRTQSVVPVFDYVFADIGDEQSIEQSLRRSRAHAKHCADFRQVTPIPWFCWMNWGPAQTPTKGRHWPGPLEHLVEECLVVATTHYSQLKGFAFHHPAMESLHGV